MKNELEPVEKVESTTVACVVYDVETGEIIHTHQIVTLPGANPPTEEELKAEAIELASKITDRSPSDIGILPVEQEELEAGVEYKVDVKKGILIKAD
jgi:hypothetical protein